MKCWVWAPFAKGVELVFPELDARVRMQACDRGYFEVEDPRFGPNARYAFSLDGGPWLPDPRSPSQPDGVHEPSLHKGFDTFEWTDQGFRQTPLERAVVYELHIGTFSPDGTFRGILQRLDHLIELGITHIELMPLAAFPGKRGWGYDGVSWFAPFAEYGEPSELMELVNACHRRGLGVILDVVYNHLGPSGNYLGQFGPYFSGRYSTPWGPALNFDAAGSDEVRRFVCDNALHWLENYHIDGLRLDAVHAIFDQSAVHILEQLSNEVRSLANRLNKPLVLVAESHLNDPRFVYPAKHGGLGLDGQWSDDFHHALFTLLTGELDGYYADFGSLQHLADAICYGFAYRGQYSKHRQHCYGREPTQLSGRHFQVFWQNHDQVGNRAMGDRPDPSLSLGQRKIAAALTLLSPHVPLIFMGQEWGTCTPFQYFTDHSEPELAQAVREGRQREFAEFGWDPEQVPDPQAETTFRHSQLDFGERDIEPHTSLYLWYRRLIELRKSEAALTSDRLDEVSVKFDERERWLCMRRNGLAVLVNFDASFHYLDRALLGPLDSEPRLLLSSEDGIRLTESEIALPGHGVLITRAER